MSNDKPVLPDIFVQHGNRGTRGRPDPDEAKRWVERLTREQRASFGIVLASEHEALLDESRSRRKEAEARETQVRQLEALRRTAASSLREKIAKAIRCLKWCAKHTDSKKKTEAFLHAARNVERITSENDEVQKPSETVPAQPPATDQPVPLVPTIAERALGWLETNGMEHDDAADYLLEELTTLITDERADAAQECATIVDQAHDEARLPRWAAEKIRVRFGLSKPAPKECRCPIVDGHLFMVYPCLDQGRAKHYPRAAESQEKA